MFAEADPQIVATAMRALKKASLRAYVGPSWTTDAPFRETSAAVAAARAKGVLAVEMEAAGLYTFARKRSKAVLVPRTSPIEWGSITRTLRRAKQMERSMH